MYYQTNCTDAGETITVELTAAQIQELHLSHGDGQGFLLDGYFLEEIEVKVERNTISMGSCGFCNGEIVADEEIVRYEDKIIDTNTPAWGACFSCGAI